MGMLTFGVLPCRLHVILDPRRQSGAIDAVTKRLWERRIRWNKHALQKTTPQTLFVPKESKRVEVQYPFGSDPVLREHYRNPWDAIRLGRLMEDMDSLAGVVAYEHW